jgi:hypothetical protein
MATFFKDKEITAIFHETKAISAVYYGARLVWEAIRSCFGKGYWINEYPWDNGDKWANK